MITLAYYSNGHILFNREHLVFRSVNKINLHLTHDICFEWKIFGLKPEKQPRCVLFEEADKLTHPKDCVLDIDATINYLRYRVIYNSSISNMK